MEGFPTADNTHYVKIERALSVGEVAEGSLTRRFDVDVPSTPDILVSM